MDRSGEQPEVLLPPGADEVAAHALAPPPHRQRQALRPVYALLHQLLLLAAAPAPQEAAERRGFALAEHQHGRLQLLHLAEDGRQLGSLDHERLHLHLRLAGLAKRAEGVGERGGVLLRSTAAAAPAVRRQDVEQGEEVAPVGDVGERPHHGVLGAGALVHHHHHPLPRRRRGLLSPAEPAAAAVSPRPALLPGPAPRPAPAAGADVAVPLPLQQLVRRAVAVARAQLPQEVLAADLTVYVTGRADSNSL